MVRAYIQHKLYNPPGVLKLYYQGPMFRYERPQAGRFRQFYQIGVEALGTENPLIDFEVMTMLIEFFRLLGLDDLELQINSLGCSRCRPGYRDTLKSEIRKHLNVLCENCCARYERNPLRVLDCKVETDQEIARHLPKTIENLCTECEENFTRIRAMLDGTGVPYSINPQMVRGLDYYTRTTFEVVSKKLGAQNALCGGGRYDTLVEEFDGPATPCFGFAVGMDRLLSVIPFEKMDGTDIEVRPDVFLVALGDPAAEVSFRLAHQLRSEGLAVEMDYDRGSLKSQMRKANKANSLFTLILGENEIQAGKYLLKDMETGTQTEIAADTLSQTVKNSLRRKADAPLSTD